MDLPNPPELDKGILHEPFGQKNKADAGPASASEESQPLEDNLGYKLHVERLTGANAGRAVEVADGIPNNAV